MLSGAAQPAFEDAPGATETGPVPGINQGRLPQLAEKDHLTGPNRAEP